jgi:gluconolactonase
MLPLIHYQEAAAEVLNGEGELEVLVTDARFTEGPVWNKEGFYLFSDIPANAIYKLEPGREKEVYLLHSGTTQPDHPDINGEQPGSNGLGYDEKGHLLICQHGGHALVQYDGAILRPLAESFLGCPLNSPNDLIVHEDGRIYFSDPPYGLKEGKLNPSNYQPLAGVYCLKEGALELVCDKYKYPNGVCLSPDGETLYICSTKTDERFISAYSTVDHQYKGVVAEENSDGLEIDPRGRFYLCSREGLLVLDAEGQRLALLPLPKIPANCCWGGKDGRDLLITAREEVYLIRNFRKD